MTLFAYFVGAALGAVAGYVLSFGAFVLIDACVHRLSLDAGWGFVEAGVVLGCIGGVLLVRRLRHLRRSHDSLGVKRIAHLTMGALGGLVVGAFAVWAAATFAFPEERENAFALMFIGAAAGLLAGLILAYSLMLAPKEKSR